MTLIPNCNPLDVWTRSSLPASVFCTIPTPDKAFLQLAREMAESCHRGQEYGHGEPYYCHLEDVDSIVREFNLPILVRICAYLHDIVEDTNVTQLDVLFWFGPSVAEAVWRVTDEPGRNRKERHEKTYLKIDGHPTATWLKLCDRIANVRRSRADSHHKLLMYHKEHKKFREALDTGIGEAAWKELDDLFKVCGEYP